MAYIYDPLIKTKTWSSMASTVWLIKWDGKGKRNQSISHLLSNLSFIVPTTSEASCKNFRQLKFPLFLGIRTGGAKAAIFFQIDKYNITCLSTFLPLKSVFLQNSHLQELSWSSNAQEQLRPCAGLYGAARVLPFLWNGAMYQLTVTHTIESYELRNSQSPN